MQDYIFTSESVTEGHPDKMADQISDAILDAMIAKDPNSHVACETFITTGLCVVGGEVRTDSFVDIQKIVRNKIIDIGYDHSDKGFDGHSCGVLNCIHEQSVDIAIGVDEAENKDQGAGDQGIMFGYAVNETPNYMPLSIDLAHKLAYAMTCARKDGRLPLLRADGKSQVSVEYKNGEIKRLDSIVLSTQHSADMSLKDVEEGLRAEVISKIVDPKLIDEKTKIYINPTGRFVIGGPMGDAGLTGRKIIVDTYGGHGGHGGGAFSGKDPSKVDRSAAYACRQIAKNIVAAGLCDRCLIQVGYAIGVAEPVSLNVNTYGTEKIPVEKIARIIKEVFDMRPKAIIKRLNLLRPIYSQTAAYGHFGREGDAFTWEKLDYVDQIKSLAF